jgi:hypothetical protein
VLLRLITQGQSGREYSHALAASLSTRLPILTYCCISAEQVCIQAMQELHSLFRLNPSSTSMTSATKALSQLIIAFHNNRITSLDARAEFYALLANYLPLLKSNIAQVVDVLRVGSKTFHKQVNFCGPRELPSLYSCLEADAVIAGRPTNPNHLSYSCRQS